AAAPVSGVESEPAKAPSSATQTSTPAPTSASRRSQSSSRITSPPAARARPASWARAPPPPPPPPAPAPAPPLPLRGGRHRAPAIRPAVGRARPRRNRGVAAPAAARLGTGHLGAPLLELRALAERVGEPGTQHEGMVCADGDHHEEELDLNEEHTTVRRRDELLD